MNDKPSTHSPRLAAFFVAAFVVLLPLTGYTLITLELPILTEAREYVHYGGWVREGPLEMVLRIIEPTGSNTRYVSMLGFSATKVMCGYEPRCINGSQLSLLGIAGALIFFHIYQLVGRLFEPALATLLWFGSAATRSAAFWQAVQHDKLALIFVAGSLAAAYSLRSNRSVAVSNLLLLPLAALALNSKEVAFALPIMLLSQAVLLSTSRSECFDALKRISAPVLFSLIFIAGYFLRLADSWKGHIGGGDWVENARKLFFRLWNGPGRDDAPLALLYVISIVAIAVAVRAGTRTASTRSPRERRLVPYLLSVAGAGLATALFTRHQSAYYLLVPCFAVYGACVIACGHVFQRAGLRSTLQKLAMAATFLPFFLLFANDFRDGRKSERFLARAANVSLGLDIIAERSSEARPHEVVFVFHDSPHDFFYFFRGGSEDADPLSMNFAVRAPGDFRTSHLFDVPAPGAEPRQLVVEWDSEFRLVAIELGNE